MAALSSTKVRGAFGAGDAQALRRMLPPPTLAYIARRGLYGAAASLVPAAASAAPAAAPTPAAGETKAMAATAASAASAAPAAVASANAAQSAVPAVRRVVFISASAMARFWREVPAAVLESCLLFFGSKRRWLFPANAAERKDAQRQPGRYHLMERAFLDFVAAKEARGHVWFLKRAELRYEHYPGDPDPDAFGRASAWLEGLGYAPLRLDAAWWRDKGKQWEGFRWECRPGRVIRNFRRGYHEYNEVCELLAQSDGRLVPMKRWSAKSAATSSGNSAA